ncbi:SDR family oxidoreductase [Wenxinia marina]|uniref:Putative nucleoside-diphosphate-sugar epimerase n=1 Tax=Wenxinia marina DSM 24838 TaxID=1123501 RepID=A0A0D0QG45_9RHOB|nr:SDR family oxidoreductase [Wenxinia marina]KIQ71192.1 putative nucleoside-diphosphate-sugar epimerase [Wenxinia marina DSM 24838]GGL81755.1 3-beta hydroxysteroid dehydrogenase [Wenxinia marina]
MPTILIAGATGYLGRHLCTEYRARGWRVHALVRNAGRAGALDADRLIEAEATQPRTLQGAMDGADLVVSALGITRQADGLGYRDVDYRANLNLLDEARAARIPHFAYIHVLNADAMAEVPLVAAKRAFVEALRAADIRSTVIAPSGYFSDMEDVLAMARSGRVWLFGSGEARINPIHGADLAAATADAVAEGRGWLDVGGPDVLTQAELARLAFATLDRPARITRLPDCFRRAALAVLPRVTPRRIHGPAQFFLTAMGLDMVGAPRGTRRLADHFASLAERTPSHSIDRRFS